MNPLIKVKSKPASLLKPLIGPSAFHCCSLIHSSSDTCARLIETYSLEQSLLSGRALHAHLIVAGPSASLPIRVASKFVHFYVQFGRFADARFVFDGIPQTDPRRWTALLGAYSGQGYHDEALRAFREMQQKRDAHAGPQEFVLPSILKSCGRSLDLRAGECMHAVVMKRHCMEGDLFVSCGLIDMYSKCGLIGSARRVFEALPVKDSAVLNALVSGYAHHGLMEEALRLVENARLMGLNPDLVTWNSIISGFSRKGDALMVPKVFKAMMIDGFEPDVVSWTSVISGFIQNFRICDALWTFSLMLANEIRPNSATISSILPACASLADLRRGKEIHGHAVAIGVEKDKFVRSALVDMYAKCGLVSHAKIVFDEMSERSSVSWNSMIFGLANNGYCKEAIETFAQLEKEDNGRIDHLTFTAALTACSHGAMTELGRSLFRKMQEVYGMQPKLEHYACMVDLLGRGGNLSEAHNLITAMPMEPDLFVWGALLGACRMHGNIELAKVAARHLSELEPQSTGSCLSLSVLYANAGSWGNAARLKKMMQRSKMRKFQGRTWIEVMR